MSQRWILCVIGGPANGRKLTLESDGSSTIGRAPSCTLSLDDAAMAGEHCMLTLQEGALTLRPYDSESGTLLQGAKLTGEATLKHGDWVRVGASELVFYQEGQAGALMRRGNTPHEQSAQALAELRAALPLYAVVNVAQDVAILSLLRETSANVQCLLDEPLASERAYLAPYLVQLAAGDALLDVLVELGWGKSWGIFMRYARPQARLRSHLQHLYAGAAEPFPFFDPATLLDHLEQCSDRERNLLFGDVETIFAEGPDGLMQRQTP